MAVRRSSRAGLQRRRSTAVVCEKARRRQRAPPLATPLPCRRQELRWRPDLPAELDSKLGGASLVLEVLRRRRRQASTHSDGDEIHRLPAGSWAGGAELDLEHDGADASCRAQYPPPAEPSCGGAPLLPTTMSTRVSARQVRRSSFHRRGEARSSFHRRGEARRVRQSSSLRAVLLPPARRRVASPPAIMAGGQMRRRAGGFEVGGRMRGEAQHLRR
jgi:hypothetical protein